MKRKEKINRIGMTLTPGQFRQILFYDLIKSEYVSNVSSKYLDNELDSDFPRSDDDKRFMLSVVIYEGRVSRPLRVTRD